MEIKAEKLETKNTTELSVADYLILGGGLMIAAGYVYNQVS
ncbi:MAG TPA: hypothetical protein PLH27_03680 [bacterium]|nr:hypothetical protein [bacterium]HMZ04712.1 hypothetical protein [bacterium]HNB10670.1 hypothetical protein [bacterium]HNB56641.1 hypothetical protein [bacterium]HNC48061.1 hypothetical protein [bacterium]